MAFNLPFGASMTGDDGSSWAGGSDGGGQQLSSPSGGDMSGLIKAGGSGFSALAGALLALRGNKKAKEIGKIQREVKRKSYLDQVNDSLLNEGEGNIKYDRGMHDLNSELGAANLGESSEHNVANTDAKHQNTLRTWALQKQRADLKYGYEQSNKIDKLHRDLERIQQQNATITAAIDTATSVGSMAAMCDRNVKREFDAIDPQAVLQKVMTLPMMTWRYEWETPDVRHLGPIAQDWHALLGFGRHHDGKKIDFVDAFGVALTSIQALGDLARSQARKIQQLEAVVLRGK